jgi:hypothetical protein
MTRGYLEELPLLVGTRPLILADAAILIVDTDRRLLLVQRADTDTWTIPVNSRSLRCSG